MIKYRVRPGYVRSRNDGDIHYISVPKLIGLYGVDPSECIDERDIRGMNEDDLILLRPREDGNYEIPNTSTTAN